MILKVDENRKLSAEGKPGRYALFEYNDYYPMGG